MDDVSFQSTSISPLFWLDICPTFHALLFRLVFYLRKSVVYKNFLFWYTIPIVDFFFFRFIIQLILIIRIYYFQVVFLNTIIRFCITLFIFDFTLYLIHFGKHNLILYSICFWFHIVFYGIGPCGSPVSDWTGNPIYRFEINKWINSNGITFSHVELPISNTFYQWRVDLLQQGVGHLDGLSHRHLTTRCNGFPICSRANLVNPSSRSEMTHWAFQPWRHTCGTRRWGKQDWTVGWEG